MDGLRIDHPDGLADPAGYLAKLRDRGVAHVWVEKILEPGEELPDWPVEGTVGYEFMGDATGLFIDPAGEGPLTALYAEMTGERRDFEELAAARRRSTEAHTTFQPEVRAAAGAGGRAGDGGRGRRAARVPDLRGAGPAGDRPARPAGGGGGRPAGAGEGRADRPRRRGRGGVRGALPADDGRGDGEGRGGHGPLPLHAPRGAERGGRRPRPLRPHGRGGARRERLPGGSASRAACSPPRRTTRSARGTYGRGSAPSPPSRSCGASGCATGGG